MRVPQPWLSDRTLLAVPLGWRRCAWATRMVAAEHGLMVSVSVAWAPPNSWATPALAVGGDVTPSRTLSARRQEIQRHGLRQLSRCAAQATRFCMACASAEPPGYVRLVSGGTVDVVAMLCLSCEQFAEEHGADFGRSRSPISGEADHLFRSKPITRFGRSRSPVSVEADQGMT